MRLLLFSLLIAALLPAALPAAGTYVEVSYPPSDKPGELIYGVTYTAWLPPGVKTVRGVIVHQHGCGEGACKGGATAAYDLHWQALAQKWDCALLGPSFQQPEGADCRKWCDPRHGSGKVFLRALDDLAAKSGHPELAQAPWCLWGHSGGGFWSSLMQTLHPDRIVAIWFRSGTAYATWEKGDIEKPALPAAMFGIPMMCNPGAKENGDKRFNGAWTGSMAMFKAYRAQGAPIGFAPDPRTGHECGDSRYLAIPFFDACLALRLPETGNTLKSIDTGKGWLAPLLGAQAQSAQAYKGPAQEALWLPSAAVAKAWEQYVKTGATEDPTPPAAAHSVKAQADPNNGGRVVTWEAEADFESGIRQFIILRDGQEIARVPETPKGRFGRPLFQSMSFHDTPEAPLPEMKYHDKTGTKDARYTVQVINSAGLQSTPN